VTNNLPLPFDAEPEPPVDTVEARIDARDRAARERAVDPRVNVALEASAGTGKTKVLVDRYVNLLKEGVDPSNVLAITFTRKAAAEMRQRVVAMLTQAAERGEILPERWRELQDRRADIAISTIDAFCLSLLREFPLEADLDPGFSMADETEVPRLVDEALDRALRICRSIAATDENVALVFAKLGDRNLRKGLALLLGRRIVAPGIIERYIANGPPDWTVDSVARRGAARLRELFAAMRGGLDALLDSGPLLPGWTLVARQLRAVVDDGCEDPLTVQAAFSRVRGVFCTKDGEPRKKLIPAKKAFATDADYNRHRDLVIEHAPAFIQAYDAHRHDLNVLVSRGVQRVFRVAEQEYRRTLDTHAVLDFSDVLLRALHLLRQMEEFSQSRYRLESRYHHVLVDEFQDTSRAQWELVSLLVQAWGAGAGLAHQGPLEPSVFIVGDRKQSIYGFRDADVSVLRDASRHLASLRQGSEVRHSISRSFRSRPALLSFFNDVCAEIEKVPSRSDAFAYDEDDRFPIDASTAPDVDTPLGILAADTPEACAELAADEIARLIDTGAPVRDRETKLQRPVQPGDVAILFRTRESHREFEQALERRGIPSYVYKGLGFFDADEIKDALSLLWYLADPISDLRAAAFLRSRFIRVSDEGLRRLSPRLADALRLPEPPPHVQPLDAADARVFEAAREATGRWRKLVDRLPPAELLDLVLQESAYAAELGGPRQPQARENLKKLRALIRRMQNRGYATLGRIAAHLDRLAVGDEANAAIDATNAVNLMTVHASKGLEFPVVFLVNLARGTGNWRDPIRIGTERDAVASVSVGDFLSESDEDEAPRDNEETKRLLYVALTRARDRLYLASAVKDGKLFVTNGSLASVLPVSVHALFVQAMAGPDTVTWTSRAGAAHTMRVCRAAAEEAGAHASGLGASASEEEPFAAPDAGAAHPPVAASATTGKPSGPLARLATGGPDDLLAVEAAPGPISSTAAAALAVGLSPGSRAGLDAGPASDRVVGVLVHRLLQHLGVEEADDARLRAEAGRQLTEDEAAEVDDRDAWIGRAVQGYLAISRRPDLRALLGEAEAFYEVPFSMLEAGQDAPGTSLTVEARTIRGTIDCLARHPDGRITVLEFKTGRARPEHQAQVDVYRRAAEAAFPGAAVTARVVYADPATQ
jgi:ATP-dependent helicase/nuclease subunit A